MKSFLVKLLGVFVSFKGYLFNNWLMYFPSHTLRAFLMKRTVKSFGKESSVLMGVEVRAGRNVSIGNNTIINQKVLLDGRGGKLVIGNNVDIAQETNIWTLEHDVHDDYHVSKGADVIIEDYVWIASRVTILPGVTIGRGAVVASNSVVTKNVEPLTIVGGVPAKLIGQRKSNLLYKLNYRPLFR
ncbi:acyltransferase [Mucilaginibacter sp.]|uniref:acyltransferase n=1 Tax=Mucilaginibacter sp. TaxID=1882438 RepID=UPI000CBE52B2|nr:acyltransferase [Mucilaginibacter sp.]PLW91127.1 MAG: acyltransferase [Mucilaginibacter sp.]PMP64802.1 MAG: acyltransferase [Mucilaginibacter sp.]HEK19156.1 acyltransferase [Bacteroidota bacterium]